MMKNLFKHSVFLQMICVILVIVSINSVISNKIHEDLLSEVLIENMDEIIITLEDINIDLIKIYVSGEIDETIQFDVDAFYKMDRISFEVEELLEINDHTMRWYKVGKIRSVINEMKKQESLSASDLQYILNSHNIYQQIINAYDEIIKSYGIEAYIKFDQERYVKAIYKQFSEASYDIISTELFENIYDYEIKSADDNIIKIKSKITQEEASKIANTFYRDITGQEANFEIEESNDQYQFEEDWNINSNRANYNITIGKELLEVDIHLSAWGGDGQFSEYLIDKKAKEYIEQFLPENYVLYEKNIRMGEKFIETINYKFIYFNGAFYDERKELILKVDNRGKLRHYHYSLIETHKKMPLLIEIEKIKEEVNLGNIESIVLVLNHSGDFEYQVNLELNNSFYTLFYDAITGQQKEVTNNSKLFNQRIEL